jgi:hypothetical protein
MSSPLERLVAAVRADDALPATAMAASPDGGAVAAMESLGGPRSEGHPEDLELVLETVREGYLLHGGAPRVLSGEDPDLALIVGDRLYALGLERLAAARDLASVRALADAIALSAQARAAGDDGLAEAVWRAAETELGWGPTRDLAEAKDAARMGRPDAESRLRRAAEQSREPSSRALADGGDDDGAAHRAFH